MASKVPIIQRRLDFWLVGDSLQEDAESVDVMPSYLLGSHYQQSFSGLLSPGRPNSMEVCNSRVQTSFHNTFNLIGSRCNSFVMIVTRGQVFGNLMPRLFMATNIVKYLTRILKCDPKNLKKYLIGVFCGIYLGGRSIIRGVEWGRGAVADRG